MPAITEVGTLMTSWTSCGPRKQVILESSKPFTEAQAWVVISARLDQIKIAIKVMLIAT